MKSLVIISGVVLLLSACASDFGVHKFYRGAKLPDSEITKINVPGDVDVVRVDEKLLVTLFSGDPTELHVLPGTHRITLRYYQIWEVRNDLIKIISDPVTIYLTVQAGHTYQVKHNSPMSVNSAETYAPNFDFTIREIGASADSQMSSVTGETGRSSPAVVTGAASTAIAEQANAPGYVIDREAGSSAAGRPEEKAAARPPLENLKYWWGQASNSDRQKFRRWIQSP